MNNIGNFIKKYRGNMSLREFAEKCGISHTHLDSIEKGVDPRTGKPVSVTVETLKKIATAMNMSINDLLIQSGDVKIEDLKFTNDSSAKFQIFNTEEEMIEHIKKESQQDLLEQYHALFDKDDRLTEDQKKFFLDFLTEKHKEFDEKTNK